LGSPRWMKITKDLENFINLMLSLIHPELYNPGLSMLQSLREINATKEVALNWQSVYTGISVISNKKTPPHRDSKGRPEWHDILLSYSGSSARPRLLIKDIGLDLKHSSGSVVGFCGSFRLGA
jgi:2-oxoglutarate-Fe(II)-dependent dioxygenase family protein